MVTRHANHHLPVVLTGSFLLLLAALALIPTMSDFSMWYDEVNFLHNSITLNLFEFYGIERSVYAVHPPLYFLALKGASLAFGESDIVFRAMSVFSILIATAFVFRTGFELSSRLVGGVLAAVIFMGMGYIRIYSQTTHNYAFFTMLTAGLLFFFQRWWRNPQSKRASAGIVVLTTALLYTHYFSTYVIVGFNVCALLWGFSQDSGYVRIRWVALQAVSLVLFSPWLPVVYRLARGEYNRFGEKNVQESLALHSNLATVEEVITTLLYEGVWMYALMLVIGLAMLAIRPLNGSHKASVRPLVMLLVVIIFSGIAAWIGNTQLHSLLPRRMIFMLPLVAVLIGYTLSRFPAGIGVGIVAFFFALSWQTTRPGGSTGNWFYRHAIEYLAEQIKPYDVVWIYFGGELEALPLDYYTNHLLPSENPVFRIQETPDLAKLAWARTHLWVLWGPQQPVQLTEIMQARGYERVSNNRVAWINVSLYEAPPARYLEFVPDTIATEDKILLPQIYADQIELVDYQVDKVSGMAGDMVTVWLQWRAVRPVDQDYGVYVHLIEDDFATLHGQMDGSPSHAGREIPSTFWQPNTIIYDKYTFTINTDTPAGIYNLKVGFYSYLDFQRLTITSPDGSQSDGLVLTKIEVK